MNTHLLLLIAGALALVLAASALFTWRTARRIEAYLRPAGRFINVPGARLHVSEAGNGPPILMIHGLAGQMAHFSYAVLDRLAADYRVIMVDRPGSGYSTRDDGTGASATVQANAIAALVDELKLDRPLVVGHSFGGTVALTLALDHPDKAGALALIAPLTHVPGDVPPAFKGLTIRFAPVRKFVAWTFATPMAIMKSARVLADVFGPEPVPADFATRGGGLLSLRPGAFLSASADLLALEHTLPALEARYRQLRLPVRVLYGANDKILDWRANGQALVDKVPGATLSLVDAGHMLPITQPEATADFIRKAAVEHYGAAARQALR